MSAPVRRRPVEAIASRARRSIECEERIRKTLTKLRKTGLPFTVEEVCERAGVGRTFIYDKRRPEITKMVLEARDASQLAASGRIAEADAEESDSWRIRALNAEAEVKRLRAQVRADDAKINDLTGQLFDPDGVHLAEENARLRNKNNELLAQLTNLRGEASMLNRSLQASRAAVIREQKRQLEVVSRNPLKQ